MSFTTRTGNGGGWASQLKSTVNSTSKSPLSLSQSIAQSRPPAQSSPSNSTASTTSPPIRSPFSAANSPKSATPQQAGFAAFRRHMVKKGALSPQSAGVRPSNSPNQSLPVPNFSQPRKRSPPSQPVPPTPPRPRRPSEIAKMQVRQQRASLEAEIVTNLDDDGTDSLSVPAPQMGVKPKPTNPMAFMGLDTAPVPTESNNGPGNSTSGRKKPAHRRQQASINVARSMLTSSRELIAYFKGGEFGAYAKPIYMSFAAKSDRFPLGAFYWMAETQHKTGFNPLQSDGTFKKEVLEASGKSTNFGILPIHRIANVYIGKIRPIFKSMAAEKASDSECLTIALRGGRELNLQDKSGRRKQFLKELHSLMSSKKKIVDVSAGSSRKLQLERKARPAAPVTSCDCAAIARESLDSRYSIVSELISTEKSYHAALTKAVDGFIRRLRVRVQLGRPILENVEISGIFSNIEDICRLSGSLVEVFEKFKKQGQLFSHQFWKEFLSRAVMFKIYNIYCSLKTGADKFLVRCLKENRAFREFVEECEMIEKTMLSSLLITPVQRIPRYELLLKQLKKKTSEDDKLYATICGTLEKILQVANKINQSAKDFDRRHKVIELKGKFEDLKGKKVYDADKNLVDFELVTSTRYFVTDAPMRKVDSQYSASSSSNSRKTHFWLFNDALIITDGNTNMFGKFKVRDILLLEHMVTIGPSTQADNSAFYLYNTRKEKDVLYLAASQDDRDKWLDVLREYREKRLNNLKTHRQVK